MPQFRANPPRTIVQFKQAVQPWPQGVDICPAGDYYAVWNELHRTWIPLRDGDWIDTTDERDPYPIAQKVLAERYEPAP